MSKHDRYWDSSAFLAFFKEEEGRFQRCKAVLEAAEKGKVRIITSTLSFSEVVYVNGKQQLTEEIEERLRAFFEHEYIVPVDLNRSVSEYARELLWRHTHLRPYDANHLSTACHAGCTIVDAFDNDFIKLNGEFDGFDEQPIRIGPPNLPVQLKMEL